VIATGGLSIPNTGATRRLSRRRAIRAFPSPSSNPGWSAEFRARRLEALCRPDRRFARCVGEFRQHSFRENMLVTHRGLSGPAILQISPTGSTASRCISTCYRLATWRPCWMSKRPARNCSAITDAMVSQELCRCCGARSCPESRINRSPIQRQAAQTDRRNLHDWQITPSGTLGYTKAEVTCGESDTRALSSKTMECIEVPGLYFIGEVVDVTGQLGAHNFQWAWGFRLCRRAGGLIDKPAE